MTTTTIDFTKVSSEEIGRCHKVIASNGQPFYQVENESDKLDENGDIIEYVVKAMRKAGRWIYTCTCKSGENGFANVKHPSGVCKHVRWSLAAAAEEKAALKELAAAEEVAPVIEETSRDDYKRVNGVKVYAPSERKIKAAQQTYKPREFSILR